MPMLMDVRNGNNNSTAERLVESVRVGSRNVVVVLVMLCKTRLVNFGPSEANDGKRHGESMRLGNRLFGFPIRPKIGQRKCLM